tara:strand:- start:904 stop:2244 length:1341 start_codon:yes stop_codon:yes gene_type:complete
VSAKQLNSQEELTVARYLERYAETLIHDVEYQIIGSFDSVVVIPIYDEPEEQIQHFLDFHVHSKYSKITLMIWVFNAPESSIASPGLLRTQQVFKSMLEQTQANKISEGLYFSAQQKNLKILFVDRCHDHLIPDKQGVGLARKLGLDLALYFCYHQYLTTKYWCYWLYSTDADVKLPSGYGLLPPKENTTACIYPFKHLPELGFEKAMADYEFSLHYYVDSLKRAGSPYAFHTIGSLIVVSSLAYAQVRGMPKRAGAEDFYFLNKLAKLGRIDSLSSPVIQVSGRPSHRVPFGTGPALVKLNSQYEKNACFHLYHPRIFTLLSSVLSSVSEIEHSNAQDDILLSRLAVKLFDSLEKKVVSEILLDLGWQKQAAHLQHLKTAEAIQKAFHVWFDAFITLRFIHELRDRLYPNIVLTDLPEHLAESLNDEVMRGTDFDYTAWFKTLGI